MQQKLENFDLAFDEDMKPPEPKKCKKTLFETQEEKKDWHLHFWNLLRNCFKSVNPFSFITFVKLWGNSSIKD